MSTNITLIGQNLEELSQQIQQAHPQITIFHAKNAQELADEGLQSQILVATPADGQQVVERMPNLKWVQSLYAGVDPLLKPQMRRDYQLTNIRDVLGQAMSEYVVGYILAWQRHLFQYEKQQSQQQWQQLSYRPLTEYRLLCLGSGSLAQAVAKTASQLGMRVDAVSRSAKPAEGFQSVVSWDDASELIQKADVIANLLPSTEQTYEKVNAQLLSLFSSEALFINSGRGTTVDEKALLSFLDDNPNARAVLDVMHQEPLSQEHPLWRHPQVSITPHIAAPSRIEDVQPVILDNVNRYLNSQPLRYLVDFARGY